MSMFKLIAFFAVLLIAIIGGFYFFSQSGPGQYDAFAQCLTDKGAVFYGSYQCIHCKEQKDLFGKSVAKLNYVECGPFGGQYPVCTAAGIESYPTWKFADGSKVTGVRSFEQLAAKTGCQLTTS